MQLLIVGAYSAAGPLFLRFFGDADSLWTSLPNFRIRFHPIDVLLSIASSITAILTMKTISSLTLEKPLSAAI
jgi:hypothetical protein